MLPYRTAVTAVLRCMLARVLLARGGRWPGVCSLRSMRRSIRPCEVGTGAVVIIVIDDEDAFFFPVAAEAGRGWPLAASGREAIFTVSPHSS
jgi:hypothetical protein